MNIRKANKEKKKRNVHEGFVFRLAIINKDQISLCDFKA